MPLSTEGARLLAKAVTGLNSPTLYGMPVGSVGSHIGVGDNNGVTTDNFSVAHTDLQASTYKFRKAVSSISEATGVVTAVATYGTTEANFAWNEWGWFNNASGGTMLGRKVETGAALGTKTAAQVWTLTATITFSAS
jgi:hypothetical protein